MTCEICGKETDKPVLVCDECMERKKKEESDAEMDYTNHDEFGDEAVYDEPDESEVN